MKLNLVKIMVVEIYDNLDMDIVLISFFVLVIAEM
jgi:hypothetical protein